MNINRVILTGNLTRDPDLRTIPGSGTTVCKLRLAVNTRRKNNSSGDWEDKPNYFDVTVWGRQGESCGQYLRKGRPVAIDGRLDWREYEVDGQKRQAIEVIAENVQFLGGRDDGSNGGGRPIESDIPADTSGFEPAPVAAGPPGDEDIPF